MKDEDKTTLQRLIGEENAEPMLEDIREMEADLPEDRDDPKPGELQGIEIALSLTKDTIPSVKEELEELANGSG